MAVRLALIVCFNAGCFWAGCFWAGLIQPVAHYTGIMSGQQGELEARKKPEDAAAQYQAGVIYFRTGRLAAAREALARAVSLAPNDAAAWKALGVVHAAEKNYRLAEEPFRRACELNPKEEDACFYQARNFYSLNRFEPSIAAYRKALPVDANPWRVHQGMALAFEGLQQVVEAEEHFRRAVELNRGAGRTRSESSGSRPDDNPRIDLGVFLYKQGRNDEALTELGKAVSESGGSARARFALARALFSRDRPRECAEQLERAVQLQPTHWAAHLLLGKVYYRLGRAADAERHTRLGRDGAASETAR